MWLNEGRICSAAHRNRKDNRDKNAGLITMNTMTKFFHAHLAGLLFSFQVLFFLPPPHPPPVPVGGAIARCLAGEVACPERQRLPLLSACRHLRSPNLSVCNPLLSQPDLETGHPGFLHNTHHPNLATGSGQGSSARAGARGRPGRWPTVHTTKLYFQPEPPEQSWDQ